MSNSEYKISNISKIYVIDDVEHVVMENITLNIKSQDVTVILGKSGCGKTTLLRIIAKLEKASSGNIQFIKDGVTCRAKVGVVFQENRLMPWLNVSENILFHNIRNNYLNRILEKLKLNNKKSKNSLDFYLKMMNLEKFKNLYPNELSGGMAQRVSIARALSFNPDMLFMDEPFSALDYFTRTDMQNEVINIHKSTNKGIIFVTHDIDEALKIGNKIMIFSDDNNKIEQFRIDDSSYNRDLTSNYYIELKRKILDILKFH